jgi:hypothetical protein
MFNSRTVRILPVPKPIDSSMIQIAPLISLSFSITSEGGPVYVHIFANE